MPVDSRLNIVSVDVKPVRVDLSDPFVISRGAVSSAALAYVRVKLADGTEGFGEIAPFTALTGETLARSMATAKEVSTLLLGCSAADWESLGAILYTVAAGEPAARCGLECAMVDALARARGETLFDHWRALGGTPALREHETDIGDVPEGTDIGVEAGSSQPGLEVDQPRALPDQPELGRLASAHRGEDPDDVLQILDRAEIRDVHEPRLPAPAGAACEVGAPREVGRVDEVRDDERAAR